MTETVKNRLLIEKSNFAANKKIEFMYSSEDLERLYF